MSSLNKALAIFLAILLTSFSAASLSRAQDLSTKRLTLSDFNVISLETVGDVVIVYDPIHSVTIEAEAKILPLILAVVEGKALRIYAQKEFKTKFPIKIKINLSQLNEVTLKSSGSINLEKWKSENISFLLSGSGSIKAMDIHSEKITANLSGSGDMHFAGRTAIFYAAIDGVGTIEADKLLATSVTTAINGSGDINVKVTKLLNASISGSGRVSYLGNPKLLTSIGGVGEVVKQ